MAIVRGSGRESGEPGSFYSLPPALGKRAGMGLVQGRPANRGPFGRGEVAVRAGVHEPFFRGAGFPADTDGRAQPAATAAADVGCRYL